MAKSSNVTSSEAESKKNKKKKRKSGPNVVAMKLKAPKTNPFESIWSRRKFDILGKKRKGEERRIGLARSHAIEKRKKTLLKEYEQSVKASVFVDKRIGEQNEALEEFDKALLRSQRQMLKGNKKSKYNLSDGEDEDFGIEGLGALSERDDYEDEMLPDDEGDSIVAARIENESSSFMEIGAVEGGENKHKSKKEVMAEIIAKSKFYKAQKAKTKEDNERLVEELNQNFASLVQSEAWLSMTNPGNVNALKALVKKSSPTNELRKKDDFPGTSKLIPFEQDKPDSYDKLVKELALDMRARPSDRIKTPEEIAQEERERLELLEEERQKRMLATDEFSDEENEDTNKTSAQKLQSLSGDDLGDSFTVDEDAKSVKGWVDQILERENDSGSEDEDEETSENSDEADGDGDGDGDEESDEDHDIEGSEEDKDASERNQSLKDWEQSDDDILDTDLEDESNENEHNQKNVNEKKELQSVGHKLEKNKDLRTSKSNQSCDEAKKLEMIKRPTKVEIPYIIEAPKSLEEFSALLDNGSSTDIILIISRIRASNAIKLAAENRKKMQVFYGVLLQYFAVLASKNSLNMELLNLLVKPLMEMSVEIPYFAAICARQRILHTRTQFCESVKNQGNSAWPSSKTLILFRLWSMIFPCSDFRHVVMTPAILLMCEYLTRCPVLTGRDFAVGSFLCSLLLSVTKQSLKFYPEAIIFLRSLLMSAIDRKSTSWQDPRFSHLVGVKAVGPLLCMNDCVEDDIKPLNFFMIMDMPEDSSFFKSDNFRAALLMTISETLQGFVNNYEKLSSFPEMFLPISSLLLEVAEQQNMPDALQNKFKNLAELIMTKLDEHHMIRQPLQLRKQKPVPVKLLNPKFEENYVKGRDYDPDRERAESRKLRKLIKAEAKGAIRELRKDNKFLLGVKEKGKERQREEMAEKYGKAKAFLQEQEHAFKSGLLGGKGKKRRR